MGWWGFAKREQFLSDGAQRQKKAAPLASETAASCWQILPVSGREDRPLVAAKMAPKQSAEHGAGRKI